MIIKISGNFLFKSPSFSQESSAAIHFTHRPFQSCNEKPESVILTVNVDEIRVCNRRREIQIYKQVKRTTKKYS